MTENHTSCSILEETNINSKLYNGVILITWPGAPIPSVLTYVIQDTLDYDPGLKKDIGIIYVPDLSAKRLVHAPLSQIDPDYNDVRVFKETAYKAVKRGLKAGINKPLFAIMHHPCFDNSELAMLLGALEALYIPLPIRERQSSDKNKIRVLGVWSDDLPKTRKIIELAKILESGLEVARDIGCTDPDRMSPSRIQLYLTDIFEHSNIEIQIMKDLQEIATKYPLFESYHISKHDADKYRGNIIFLEYKPDPLNLNNIRHTLFLIGKGDTQITSNPDVKMKEKSGAATVAGFMKIIKDLKPPDMIVYAVLSLMQFGVESSRHLDDEGGAIARSGVKISMHHSDTEGRLMVADILCEMKEKAIDAINPHLYTISSLAIQQKMGTPSFSIVTDNGPAKKNQHYITLQNAGEKIGDFLETATIRKEDLQVHRGKFKDVLHNNIAGPAVQQQQKHQQGPAAFLLLASGLDKHGSGAEKPLKYSHLDIIGTKNIDESFTVPILALTNLYLLSEA